MERHSEVAWTGELPHCDLCSARGVTRVATYDAKTKQGPWGYLCDDHFASQGVGLGLGRGQRLRPVSPVPPEVDFAARFYGGDWTEQQMPAIERHPGLTGLAETVWLFADIDGQTFSVTRQGGERWMVQWDEDDQTLTAYVRKEPDGTFAELAWDGTDERGNTLWKVTSKTRLDIDDEGWWGLVDIPVEGQ